jgi:hypothetical protein
LPGPEPRQHARVQCKLNNLWFALWLAALNLAVALSYSSCCIKAVER